MPSQAKALIVTIVLLVSSEINAQTANTELSVPSFSSCEQINRIFVPITNSDRSRAVEIRKFSQSNPTEQNLAWAESAEAQLANDEVLWTIIGYAMKCPGSGPNREDTAVSYTFISCPALDSYYHAKFGAYKLKKTQIDRLPEKDSTKGLKAASYYSGADWAAEAADYQAIATEHNCPH
ncbi:hypothetical protein [Solilutibacter silvestris]|uniref:hypothetical protein n=1 Tax=Solilutibacter silvestris TaxID=1645665 RepID=UPI003D35407F